MSKPKTLHMYMSCELDGPTTQTLQNTIKSLIKDRDWSHYEIQRGESDPAHLTVIFAKDLPVEDYKHKLETEYLPQVGHTFELEIHGISIDPYCVAMLCYPRGLNYYPESKYPHLTMMLHDKPPVYSNQLMTNVFEAPENQMTVSHLENHLRTLCVTNSNVSLPPSTFYCLPEPIIVTSKLQAMGFYRPKKPKAPINSNPTTPEIPKTKESNPNTNSHS